MTRETPRIRRLERALWIGVGAGIFADLLLPLGLGGWVVGTKVGLLWPAAVAAALGAVVGLAVRGLERDRATLLLGAGAALVVLSLVLLDFLPPVARDELTHHLAIPALFARAGRVYEIPFADQAYYPMLVTLLYTPLVESGWESAAKLLHLEFGVAAAALLCLALRALRSPSSLSLLVAVLLLTTPTVAILGASAYVDLGLLFFTSVACGALLLWSQSQHPRHLALVGLGAGLAATVKYNGFLLLPLLGAVLLLLARDRRPAAILRIGTTFALFGLVPLLPWLAKNWAQTGNPMYPLLYQAFGGTAPPSRPSIDVFSYRRALYGEGWFDVVLVPARVFLTGRDADPARFDGVFNPMFLAGFVLPFLPGASSRTRAFALFAAAFLVLVLFLAVFRSRYAIPALVPLALLAAELGRRALRAGPRWRVVLVGVAVAALSFNAVHLARFVARVDPFAYLRGRETREEYIARFVPEYPVTRWANRHLPSDATVYLAFLGQRGYYWRRSYTYDFHFSGIELREAVEQAREAGEIATLLRADGISHIASADALLSRFLAGNLDPSQLELWRRFAFSHLRPLYRHGGITLYEIV